MTCDVCGVELAPDALTAIVGTGRLCMTGANCFGWFSGYPWVLFEMKMLVSRLWEPQDDPHMAIGQRIWPVL